MADAQDILLKSLASTALANNAKAGGYGSGIGNILANIGAFASPLATIGQTGVIPAFMSALGNVGTLENQRAYNQYLVKQAQQEMVDKKDTEWQRGSAYGKVDPRFSGYGKLAPDEMNTIMQNAGNVDAGNAALAYQQGGYPKSFGLTPSNVSFGYSNIMLPREAQTRDNPYPQLQQGVQLGQGLSGGRIDPEATPPVVGAPVPGQPSGLSAGASYQAPIQAPTVNPFFRQAFLPPEQALGAVTAGLTDSQKAKQLAEDVRSNKANEGLEGRKVSVSERDQIGKEQGGYYSRVGGGGGGSGNPYTVLNAEQNYLSGQVKTIDDELKRLGFMDKSGNIKAPEMDKVSTKSQWFDGKRQVPVAQMRKMERAAALIQKREQLNTQIYGGANFGAGAIGNLNNSTEQTSAFAKWQKDKGRQK